jgi:Flp pilus assembly protein TadD
MSSRVNRKDPAALLAAAEEASRRGDIRAAAQAWEQLAKVAPHIPEVQNNLGVALRSTGRLADARKAFLAALRLKPDYADALSNLGSLQNATGNPGKAVETLRKARAIAPGDGEITINLGNAHRNMGNHDAALECYRSVTLGPAVNKARAAEGGLLIELGRPGDAEEIYRMLCRDAPDNMDHQVDLAAALIKQGRTDEAREVIDDAGTRLPASPRYLSARGVLRIRSGDFEAGIEDLQTAVSAEPENPDHRYQLAGALRAAGRPEEAINVLDAALKHHPDHPELTNALWLNCLYTGDFRRGWRLREKRWLSRHITSPMNDRGQKSWSPTMPKNRVVRVWGEQGIGDEIMFTRDLPAFIDLGWQVLIECDSRLCPLLQRRLPGISIIPTGHPDGMAADCQIPMGSLPHALYPTVAPPASTGPHMIADPALVTGMREWLDQLPGGHRLGISWRSKNPDMGPGKSMNPSDLARFCQGMNITLVNLQYGECREDIERVRRELGVTIHEHPSLDRFNDIDGLAALVTALDSVLSTSNTTVHLAGALGVPVQVLVPHAADWRWFRDMTVSPWYTDLRVYRQPENGDWSGAVHAARNDFTTRFMA